MRWWVLLGLATAVALAPRHDARACGNAVQEIWGQQIATLRVVEERLRSDRADEAARVMLAQIPDVRTMSLGGGEWDANHPKLVDLMALAVVRVDGDVDAPVRGWRNGTADERRANVDWAVQRLERLVETEPADARIETHLGEALAKVPERRSEALRRLARLEARDVLATAHGYAALAQLRRERAADRPSWLRAPLRTLESARASLSLARCANMSNRAAFCRGRAAPAEPVPADSPVPATTASAPPPKS